MHSSTILVWVVVGELNSVGIAIKYGWYFNILTVCLLESKKFALLRSQGTPVVS